MNDVIQTSQTRVMVLYGPPLLALWGIVVTFIYLVILSQFSRRSRIVKISFFVWIFLWGVVGFYAMTQLTEKGDSYFHFSKSGGMIYVFGVIFICFLASPWIAFGVLAVLFPRRSKELWIKLKQSPEKLNEDRAN